MKRIFLTFVAAILFNFVTPAKAQTEYQHETAEKLKAGLVNAKTPLDSI